MERRSILVLAITMLGTNLFVGSHEALAVTYNDGGVHEINFYINDVVVISDSPSGDATKINLVSDGVIENFVWVCGNSQLNISGGKIGEYLWSLDGSQVSISSGSIGTYFTVKGNNKVTISGGSIGTWLNPEDNSEVTILGGTIGDHIATQDSSRVTILDVWIGGDLIALENSQISLSGGSIGHWLQAWGNGVLAIYGSDFNYELGPITVSSGRLTGALANGDPINNNFYIYDKASIVLVPEPATILLLGFGAVLLRRRR